MLLVKYIKKHEEKVQFIIDFFHSTASILFIKGVSKEGKKETLAEALSLCGENSGEYFTVQEMVHSECSWTFVNINTGQLKIIMHIYSWENVPFAKDIQYIAFDRDPSYSSSSSSSSSSTLVMESGSNTLI
jgi:hypothetical protein